MRGSRLQYGRRGVQERQAIRESGNAPQHRPNGRANAALAGLRQDSSAKSAPSHANNSRYRKVQVGSSKLSLYRRTGGASRGTERGVKGIHGAPGLGV